LPEFRLIFQAIDLIDVSRETSGLLLNVSVPLFCFFEIPVRFRGIGSARNVLINKVGSVRCGVIHMIHLSLQDWQCDVTVSDEEN
jgi:hypothetical protein